VAQETWNAGPASSYDPEMLPAERWAVYSNFPLYHKLIGILDQSFLSTFGFSALAEYIKSKHQLTFAKLEGVNTVALQSYLLSLPQMRHASIPKMIHDWMPTYSSLCRQGRESTALCPRCRTTVETPAYIYTFPDESSSTNWRELLSSFIESIKNSVPQLALWLLLSINYPWSKIWHSSLLSIYLLPYLLPSIKCQLMPFVTKTSLDGKISLKATSRYIGWMSSMQQN